MENDDAVRELIADEFRWDGYEVDLDDLVMHITGAVEPSVSAA